MEVKQSRPISSVLPRNLSPSSLVVTKGAPGWPVRRGEASFDCRSRLRLSRRVRVKGRRGVGED